MKFFVTLIASIGLISASFTQTSTNTEKIIAFLGTERYNDAFTNNTGLIVYLEAKLLYGYKIVDFNAERYPNHTVLLEVPVKMQRETAPISVEEFVQIYESGNLNFLFYPFPCEAQQNLYFKLGNTGKAIIIYSNEFVNSQTRN